jgi:hypothetical protein
MNQSIFEWVSISYAHTHVQVARKLWLELRLPTPHSVNGGDFTGATKMKSYALQPETSLPLFLAGWSS